MKLEIIIDSSAINQSLFIDAYNENNHITIFFSNIENYEQFINTFTYDATFFTELGKKITLKKVIKHLNVFESDLKSEIINAIPIIYLKTYKGKIENIFKTNKPLIIDFNNLELDEILSILTHPENNNPNILYKCEIASNELLTLQETIDMYQHILNISDKIKKRNYSPLETIYYIYYNLKAKMYNKENENESLSTSRSINQIRKTNKIVCEGYSNYFFAVARFLNLSVFKLTWASKDKDKPGHAENIVFINDSKYEVTGIYAIDTTWDSKRDENDVRYKHNIRHFLIPLSVNETEKATQNLIFPDDNIYYSIIKAYERYKKFIELNAPSFIINEELKRLIKKINKLYDLLSINFKITEQSDIDKEIKKIIMLANKLISPTILENVIWEVSKPSDDELNKMIKTSYHYQLLPKESKLLYELFRTRHLK